MSPVESPPGTERTPRVVAARKLLRRVGRDRAGRFLVEGAQAVREALDGDVTVHELFVAVSAAARHRELVDAARTSGLPVSLVTDRVADALSDTVTPQGLVAVCDLLDVPVPAALAAAHARRRPLVAVLVGVADPGNAGTVIRVADAAGAGAVLLAGDTVDPHNGKAVRASTGSVFHLPLARDRDAAAVLAACRAAGLILLAADGRGELDLQESRAAAVLAEPTAWIFGNEAHGLPPELAAGADHRVRVPVYGRAESLNLATAAAVCLYASAAARRPA
jgi:RNA methyltransferase, TrmH family